MSDSLARDGDAGQSTQPLASVEGSGDPAETPEEAAQTPATGQRAAAPEAAGVVRTDALGEPLEPRVDEGAQAGERAAQNQGRADDLTMLDRRLEGLERDVGLVRNLAMQMRDGERAWIDDRLRRSGRDLGIGLMVMVLLAVILFAANWWRTDQRFDLIAARIASLDQRAAAASAALPAPAAPMGAAAQGGNATLAELAGRLDRQRVDTGAAAKQSAAVEPPPVGPAEAGATAESQPAAAGPGAENAASTGAAVLKADRYAIQLIGFRSVASIGPFAHRLGIAGKASYTVTKHKGGDWYIVVLGDYPSREEGQAAAAALPQALRDLNPWVRPLRAGSRMFPID